MSKYVVGIGLNRWESDSRDAKNHLQDHGGERCTVRNQAGKIVAEARMGEDGKPYSVSVK